MATSKGLRVSRATRFVLVPSLAVLLLVQWPSRGFAQNLASTASIAGIVADSQGARVTDATITLSSSQRGIKRIFKTDSSGTFSFSLLQPGAYDLKAEAAGFKTYQQNTIVLEVGQAASLNVTLAVGSIQEVVSVSGEAPLLVTDNANLASEISGKQIVELPLNLRNVIGLALLDSSVNTLNVGGGNFQMSADQDISFINFGGQFFGSTSYLLDGSWDTAMGWGGVIYVPSVDNVQEFKVQTNSFTAQYGWSTGNVINVITKSGASGFHGDVYEFLRNDALDANFFFNKLNGLPKTALHRNQFGITAGGPVYIPGIYEQRERTFFFAQYEGLRLLEPATTTETMPTAAFRTGDMSALLGSGIGTDALCRPILAGQVYNPQSYSTTATCATANNAVGDTVFIRDPIAGNNLVNMIDPVSQHILGFYPAPTNTGLFNNFVATGSIPTTSNEFNVRIDHNLSDSARLYGRFSRKWETKQTEGAIYGSKNPAGPGQSNPNNRYSAALGHTRAFSSTLGVSVNLGFNRWIEGNVGQAFPFQPSTLGLPAALDANSPFFPDIQVSDYAHLGRSQQRFFFNNVGTLSGEVTKVRGAHTLSFGYMGVLTQLSGGGLASTFFSFNPAFTSGPDPLHPTDGTGNSFASFLLGTAADGATGINTLPHNQKIYHGLYLQDDWKATSKLTLNVGLRWDMQGGPAEKDNRMVYFDPTVVNPITALVNNGATYRGALVYASKGHRGLYRNSYTNFAPRVGFSYLVAKNLVARGGFGVFFPTSVLGTPSNEGYTSVTPFISSLDNGLSPAQTLNAAFSQGIRPITGNSLEGLTSLGQSTGSVVYQRASPYVEQWMFGFQYSPTRRDAVEVSYLGNHGVKMVTGNGVNLNQLNPKYLSLGTAALLNPVSNPLASQSAAFAGSPCSLDQPNVPAFQLLLPMPQYCDGVGSSFAPVGSSSYNALQTRYTHRVSNGLTVMATYTFAKFLSNVSGPEDWALLTPAVIRNYYDLAAERSVDSNDIPHSVVLSYIYPLPVGRGKKFGSSFNKPVDALLGGWQVSGISTFKEGVPLAIVSNSDPSLTFGGNQHVDVIGNPNSVTKKGFQQWFNPSAFGTPAAGSFGNAPRYFSNLRGPGYNGTDLAIEKWFDLREPVRAQFRVEMFNAFNHVNLALPNTGFDPNPDSGFGTITDAYNPRNLQLALKIYW